MKRLPDDYWAHGTYQRYKRRINPCRCADCREANRLHDLEGRRAQGIRRRSLGRRRNLVLCQEHLRGLLQAGCSQIAIGGAAGLARETIDAILHGKRKFVTNETAVILLALTPEQVWRSGGLRVPKKVTVQRIRSMMALGWSLNWQARQLGLKDQGSLSSMFRDSRETVTLETERAVRRLAEQVGDTWGPDRRVQRWAEKRGWHVPGAYDARGDLIPGAAMAQASRRQQERERSEVTRERRTQSLDEVQRLTARGWSAARIAEQLGVTERSVERYRAAV